MARYVREHYEYDAQSILDNLKKERDRMEIQKLKGMIEDWLKFGQRTPEEEAALIDRILSTPRAAKDDTDAIQYYVRGKSVHSPRKAEIKEAVRLIQEERP